MENTDEKGKSGHTGKYFIECRNGTIYLDMNSMLDPQATAGFSNMEMEISGNSLEFPNTLSAGQTLPDGMIEMKAKSGGMTLFNMNMHVTNRKVEGQETLTTPAGTFDCMKVTQDTEMKMIMNKKFKTTTWYAKGA